MKSEYIGKLKNEKKKKKNGAFGIMMRKFAHSSAKLVLQSSSHYRATDYLMSISFFLAWSICLPQGAIRSDQKQKVCLDRATISAVDLN